MEKEKRIDPDELLASLEKEGHGKITIVKYLVINAGKVITHKALLHTVWGKAYEKEVQYLRVYIGQIRRKLELDPSRTRHIITESGVGYRLL